MGFFNLQEIVAAYKVGDLDKILKKYDPNDLALIVREMEQYLKKNESIEEHRLLLDAITRELDIQNA